MNGVLFPRHQIKSLTSAPGFHFTIFSRSSIIKSSAYTHEFSADSTRIYYKQQRT